MIVVIGVCAVVTMVGFLTSPLWWPAPAAQATKPPEPAPLRRQTHEPPIRYTSEAWPPAPVPEPVPAETNGTPAHPSETDDVHQQLLAVSKRTATLMENFLDVLARQQAVDRAKAQTPPTVAPAGRPPQRSTADTARSRKEAREQMKAWKPEWVKPEASPAPDSPGRVHRLKTPWSLAPNTKIPFVTEAKVTNDTPGAFVAYVTADVKDSATQTIVVIPQYTVLGLQPSGKTILGDERLPVEILKGAYRGKWLDFPKSSVGDRAGTAGFADQINRHWLRIAASVLMTGVLKGGSSVYTAVGQETAERVGGAIGMEASQAGQRQVQQFIRTDPTLTIRPAYQGTLMLLEALELNEPLI